MAQLKAFLQKKNIFARRGTILAFLGTLTDVLGSFLGRFTLKTAKNTNGKLRPQILPLHFETQICVRIMPQYPFSGSSQVNVMRNEMVSSKKQSKMHF